MKRVRIFLSVFVLVFAISCEKPSPPPPPPSPPPPPPPLPEAVSKIVADAGKDTTFRLPVNTIKLDGSKSLDTAGRTIYYTWRQIAGPISRIEFETTNIATVYFLIPGKYDFELKVWNNGGQAYDTVSVTVEMPDNCDINRKEIPAELHFLSALPGQAYPSQMVAAGHKLIFPDAWDNATGTDSDVINLYDVQTQTWTTTKLSEKRGAVASIAAGNKVFFAGGLRDNYDSDYIDYTATNTVDIYDVSTNTWSKAQLSEARGYVQAAVVDGKVLFAGGLKDNRVFSGTVDIYDTQTNTWTIASLQTPRMVQASVTAGNKAFFTGGYTAFVSGVWEDIPGVLKNEMDVFDAGTGQWTVKTMQSTRKSSVSVIAHDDKVYLAGGNFEELFWSPSFDVEVVDVNTFSRTNLCLSQPTFYTDRGAVSKEGSLIFMGHGTEQNKFDIYNPSTGKWSVGVLPAVIPGYPRMVIVDREVYVISGSNLFKLIL